MKALFTRFVLFACLLGSFKSVAGNVWTLADAADAPKQLQVMHPTKFLVYKLDEATMKLQLWNIPADPRDGVILSLPMADGTFRDFRVWQTSLMPDVLAAKYPDIKSFTAVATDDQRVTAKLDFTLFGFDAMIFDGTNTSFIDPYDNYHDGFYMVHYKRDETRAPADRMHCLVQNDKGIVPVEKDMETNQGPTRSAARTVNGWTLRTYSAVCRPPVLPGSYGPELTHYCAGAQ